MQRIVEGLDLSKCTCLLAASELTCLLSTSLALVTVPSMGYCVVQDSLPPPYPVTVTKEVSSSVAFARKPELIIYAAGLPNGGHMWWDCLKVAEFWATAFKDISLITNQTRPSFISGASELFSEADKEKIRNSFATF